MSELTVDERQGVTAASLYGLHAEVVDRYDDPHVLVRGLTEATTSPQIEVVAREAWMGRDEAFGEVLGDPPAAWDVRPCRLYRWVPSFDGDYCRYLHHADRPGPGAFWAVECHPVRERAS